MSRNVPKISFLGGEGVVRYPRVQLQRRQTNNWFIVLCLISFFCFPYSAGSTDSAESFQRGSGKYGSFRKRPTEDDTIIYSFEFEECVLAAYNTEPVECTLHGQLDLKELAPDAVSVFDTRACPLTF